MSNMLIVDDSIDNRHFCELIANMCDIKVEQAANVDEAMSIIDNGYQPNVVLLDLMMPGRSPEELVQRVKGDSRLSETKIVLISALREVNKKAKDWGVNGALHKPFNMPKFIDAFRRFSMRAQPA